ncbi:dihydrolipoamide acetyltransferase family protein [Rhodoferax sp.]|uniref:dihydrolipoamide acetyltransferase family protein n=1 Tax=Rhodoferax sp. TaxID=50421 RepID=UPI0026277EC1|nr:dihydrolipoamide acetyltransferase family protein [Rhodoferax sp.]MDD5478239.1 dihydrolipoamide acetyltransferase family protein [Rhodoferax sp.]
MSIKTIKMPDIGEGIAEVELVAWHVQVGDEVTEDQILADVMTDKATVEIPSHVAGTVLSLDAVVGQVVAVGTEIIHINSAVAPVLQAQAAIDNDASSEVCVDTVPTLASAPATAPTPVSAPNAPSPALPPPSFGEGWGGGLPARPTTHLRPIAAPAVRRRAWELGVDLSQVPATGPAGRISQADLAGFAATHSINNSNSCNEDERYRPMDATEMVPVIGLRRKIAQKMQEAKQHIPHFTYVEEIDVTELETLRAQLNAQHANQRGRLTLLPFLMRAMVMAVREHPQVNARFDDAANMLTRFSAVHLGIATQTPGGLMVPVVRHAETLDLWASAAAVTRVSEAARSGHATREDLSGSTLTLTSLGALGGVVSTPVINYPEVAIVGTNRMVERPVFQGGLVVARKLMNLSSSFDHRVVDGMDAAKFIQHIRTLLECPGLLLV